MTVSMNERRAVFTWWAASDIVLGSLLATWQTDAEAVARSRAIGRARQVRRAA